MFAGGRHISEGTLENMFPLEVEHSINVVVWLICSSISVMVLLNLCVKLCVDSWFATTPAGIDIIIAIEKLRAMITSIALIFLLEMFLIALVAVPRPITVPSASYSIQRSDNGLR
jgi:TRAP-type C4-dicarboxylate transport system permease small subunit